MRHMAIIADDLTGASDSGVQFARKGLKTQVIFNLNNLLSDTEQIETAVIDTDSRAIPAREAYERVKESAKMLHDAGFTHIYKKMDSTLRGNIGAEIDGVLDAFPFDFAIVAPAFPKIGRTTVNGRHYLNGVPIDLTEIGRDPKCPVTESDLVKLLSSQSNRQVGLIDLQTVRNGKEAMLSRAEPLHRTGVQIMVCDAETDEDMELIAELAQTRYRILFAGSAGLADYLPSQLGLPERQQEPFDFPSSTNSVFLVAGSISEVTQEQVYAYCNHPNVVAVEMDTLAITAEDGTRRQEIDRCMCDLVQALEGGHDIALFSASSREKVKSTMELGAQSGLVGSEVANLIVDALGEVASGIVHSNRDQIQGLILTGGDTAKAVSQHLGVTGLRLLMELEPGVPISRLAGGHGLIAVTKAGAFGTRDTLVNALYALKKGANGNG